MPEQKADAPDVVLVHGHDLGRWLSVYGMPHVPSPNLAAFAESAVVFDNAHAAAPLCSPARAALFTGISPHRNGVEGLAHHGWRYRHDVVTAPERLRPLGYHSVLIGLQHEHADPTVLGFDEVGGLGFLPRAHQVADAAAGWLRACPDRAERKPLFLTVGVWEVHRPWPAEDYVPADPAQVDVPDFLSDNEHTREDIAAFHGSIRQLDDAMGALLRTIDATLDPETTMVIFTTDHGAAFPRAKSTLYDAGTGVTLLVRPPRSWAVAPRRVTDVVSHLDLVPTLLDVAGGAPAPELEGTSLVPLLHGGTGDPDRVLYPGKSYHDSYDPMRAVRSREFTYIRNFRPGPLLTLSLDLESSPTRRGMGDAHLAPRPAEELYDRRKDPDELTNVAGDPAYADVLAQYAHLLDERLVATDDPVLTGGSPVPGPRSREVDALPLLPHLRPEDPS
ncbi:sulfatase [Amycolatopsis sp. FDAARGOS 1241]|uniref:sulfatase family protein n=1 Tax=Amycolatopsis sp. FDAARGOS 1241 TaxID=2778070 RepID=UPI0019508399|nr:sulfatase [Amycolatopsis sp. FDAARGOS 1241]QRP44733.1 sulfatase [Amycolatopsis sp. FDAARGOS 1241]